MGYINLTENKVLLNAALKSAYLCYLFFVKIDIRKRFLYYAMAGVNVISFEANIIALIIANSLLGYISGAIFIISIPLSAFAFIKKSKKILQELMKVKGEYEITKKDNFEFTNIIPNIDDNRNGFFNYEGKVLISDNINRNIDSCSIKLVRDRIRLGKIRKVVKNDDPRNIVIRHAFAEAIKKSKKLFNEKKVCFSSEIDFNNKIIYVHKGTYFDSIETNDLFGRQIVKKSSKKLIYASNVTYDYNNDILLPIDNTFLNCHMGASVLAITRDKKLIVMMQGENNNVDSKKLVSTGNGSSDWKDIRKNDLIYTVKTTMYRELIEETGLIYRPLKRMSIKKNDIVVVGYFKWLDKGPKPQFVGLVKLRKIDKSMIYGTEGQKYRTYPASNIEELKSSINDLLINEKSKLAISLEVNLLCIQNWIENRENKAADWLKRT